MSKWRIAIVVGLLAGPVLGWAVVGTYYLWQIGWGFWAWWPMFLMMSVGYALAAYWQNKRQLLTLPESPIEPHWTARDREAWKLVEARLKVAEKIPQEKLGDVPFYLQTAQELARELAEFYHPGVKEPLDGVTVPEVLAVVELASHDLWELVDQHLPGGHLLTIRDWKRAQVYSTEANKWYQRAMNVYWGVSAVFMPIETVARYTASQLGLAQPMRLLQQSLFVWFYVAYLQRLGTYLIDLNSGRLRVGTRRYRELVGEFKDQLARTESPLEKQAVGPFPSGANDLAGQDAVEQVKQVTITVMGQTKAGKSSLINALLGEQRARVGVVPTTNNIERYELLTPGIPTRLVLLDTVGYAQAGPRADQVAATGEAARQSDLLFLVLHATNPARQADLDMLEKLKAWFADRPEVRRPPVIAVVTHIDLLSPAMEWKPPYDYLSPRRPKEESIRDCLAAAGEQLGDRVITLVPICGSANKVYGVEEFLLPAVATQLEEVRGVALLRCLKAEADRDRLSRVFEQMLASGKAGVSKLWQTIRGSVGTGS